MTQVSTTLPFPSSTCTEPIYPDLCVCRRVHRNQTDQHSLYTQANSVPILEYVVGLPQFVGWSARGLSCRVVGVPGQQRNESCADKGRGRVLSLPRAVASKFSKL